MNLPDETIQVKLVQLTEFPLMERCIAAAIEGGYNNFTSNDSHSIPGINRPERTLTQQKPTSYTDISRYKS